MRKTNAALARAAAFLLHTAAAALSFAAARSSTAVVLHRRTWGIKRLTAISVIVDVITVAIALKAGYAASLGAAGYKAPYEQCHRVAQGHEADRTELLDLHRSRSLHAQKKIIGGGGEGGCYSARERRWVN